jgi:hypothetical protein
MDRALKLTVNADPGRGPRGLSGTLLKGGSPHVPGDLREPPGTKSPKVPASPRGLRDQKRANNPSQPSNYD